MIGKLVLLSVMILTFSIIFSPQLEDKGELKVLPHEISGKTDSKFMLVFLHGYPNTFRMWDKMIDSLKEGYLCINLSYPNFDKSVTRKWGVDLTDIVNLVKKTLDEADPTNKYKKIFVAHDWGAVTSYLFDYFYPGYITDLVSLDVGIGLESTNLNTLRVLSYQSFLAFNFFIGGPIGSFISKSYITLNWGRPFGLTDEDWDRFNSSWNYFYFYFLKRIQYYKGILDNYQPSSHIAYIYATDKPYVFHCESFMNFLRNDEKSEVHTVTGGHWVMNKNNEFIISIIRRRIQNLI